MALGVAGPASAQTLTLMKGIDAPHYDAQRTTWGPTSDIVNMFQDTLVALDWDGTHAGSLSRQVVDDQRGRQDLYVQAARRRVVLQRQEVHRRRRRLQLQAAQGSRDQGALCLARRHHQGIARAGSLYRRIRTRGAVTPNCCCNSPCSPTSSTTRRASRRWARITASRAPTAPDRGVSILAAAHRDRAEAPRRLQMGAVDVQEQGPGEVRKARHEDRARGFQPRRSDDGRAVRHHPPVSRRSSSPRPRRRRC